MPVSDRVRTAAFVSGWWAASLLALMVPTAGSRDVIVGAWQAPVAATAFAVAAGCAVGASLTPTTVGKVSRAWLAVAAFGAVLTLVPVLTVVVDDRMGSLFQDEMSASLAGVGYGLMLVAWGARRRSVVRAVPAGAIVGLVVAIAMSDTVLRISFNDQGMIERTRTSELFDDLWPVLGGLGVSVVVAVGCAWLVGIGRPEGAREPSNRTVCHRTGEISRAG